MTNFYTIYNQRLAGYLMMHGFSLIELVKNYDTKKNMFLFANTPLLHDCIDQWQKTNKKEK